MSVLSCQHWLLNDSLVMQQTHLGNESINEFSRKIIFQFISYLILVELTPLAVFFCYRFVAGTKSHGNADGYLASHGATDRRVNYAGHN